MKKNSIFLNEYVMKTASIVVAMGAVSLVIIMALSGQLTTLTLFEEIIKAVIAAALYITFSHYKWDFMRGLMGAMLFALLYQEAFLALGELWGKTADFDSYLIMGIEGSLYLAASTMSFMMTAIIIVNHFVLEYSKAGNRANMIFNQISILLKIMLYVMLLIVNAYLDLPTITLVNTGIGYVTDLAVIIMLICIESQLDDFKEMKEEIMKQKRGEI